MEGEFVFLTGQSGAGKTTLFKILLGWEKVDRGQVLVGGLNVGKLNVDNDNQVASQYGVRSIPALLIFKDGTVANQIVGAVPKARITEILDSVI